MFYAVLGIHCTLCLILIGLVLVQQGKGADMGATFGGGGSNTVFGAAGAGNFLTRLTTGIAIAFMVTSIFLVRGYSEFALLNTAGSQSLTEGSAILEKRQAAEEAAPVVDEMTDEAASNAPAAAASETDQTENAPAAKNSAAEEAKTENTNTEAKPAAKAEQESTQPEKTE